ncbi:MAG: toprim domain-containing protein [Magnetococcales bacterium]|nr:toprim domain-containing protein [Magnetococcales bacterium]
MADKKNPAGGPGCTLKTPVNSTSRCSRRQALLPISDPVEAFRAAMAAHGLETTAPIVPDGKLRRVHLAGDRAGTRNGWFVLHLDPPASGAFGSWKAGTSGSWCAGIREQLTPTERETIRRRIEAAKRARETEEKRARETAACRALTIWDQSSPADPEHPYLVKKKVQPHGVRQSRGALVIPLRDVEGRLWSLEFIRADGSKRFFAGGRKHGGFFVIGTIDPAETLCLAEGFATGATLHETTGHPVAVAFDAGNLEPVARALRAKYPALRLVICADADPVGMAKAKSAALAVGGLVTWPGKSREGVGHGR